ncbi:helix-turn-helix transcriptional regulator [Nocardioides humi]|uniref:LuxR family transcriptional regulator n=1 Tax=Nocardioides humi TaxID=449461 RepID=A0ABN2BQB2_9ACTN|nr:LuxR family transcriptional regulator [Nocardioides humi]
MERTTGAHGGLLGRRRECTALDELVTSAKGGHGAALLVHGDAGIGKTALLDHVQEHASGCRVMRISGVEAEVELAFGGLHQLCAPLLRNLDRLAEPQRSALETAFGMSAGDPPDRFLVGLAVLNLLADAAATQPVVCLVDDGQWLDQVSAQTLAFVARRLLAERVALVFALREPIAGHPLQGLPRMLVEGLGDPDARALLARTSPGRFDDRVLDRILAEARGNPLALLELPRGLTATEEAGEPGTPQALPLAHQIERGFLDRIEELTPATQQFLLTAAAEPAGDPAVLRRAVALLGIEFEPAAAEAEATGLVLVRSMVRFRHPLVRSAAYGTASPTRRQQVHHALAEATDPDHDPERRAWHLASAVPEADEAVAAGLEQAAERARARGGIAAAAAFLDRAAQLTPDPARRGSRTVAAAQAKTQAGAFDQAVELLDLARFAPLGEYDAAQADLARGRILFASQSASSGLPLLLSAARRLEPLDPALATETYRDAMYAALTAGQMAGEVGLPEVAAAVLGMPEPLTHRRVDRLLRGIALVVAEGYAAGVPLVQQALTQLGQGPTLGADEGVGWLPLACRAAHDAWDFGSWTTFSTTLVELARELGALAVLPSALLLRLSARVYAGDLVTAESLAAQAATLGEITGSSFFAHYGALVVAPWRGQETETQRAIDAVAQDVQLRDDGKAITASEWSAAVLFNGLGRHEEALAAARRGAAHPAEMGLSTWSMLELAEAAARLGRPEEASAAVADLRSRAEAGRTDWAAGTAAYVTALVSEPDAAEPYYREALERLAPAQVGMQVARAHLVYGEWLRRQERTPEARRMLGRAHHLLTQIGATAFAERARRELAATGAAAPRPAPPRVPDALTTQEAQIARLAADGLKNAEIGAELFISSHTVDWHLRKVFAKLGVRSRRQIGAALAARDQGGRDQGERHS